MNIFIFGDSNTWGYMPNVDVYQINSYQVDCSYLQNVILDKKEDYILPKKQVKIA